MTGQGIEIDDVHWPLTQLSPPPQQVHPQATTSESQMSVTHCPLLQVSPQPQVGVQVLTGHLLFLHMPPPAQPQTPPHPSLAPQVPSWGQLGLQQLPP